MNEFLDSIKPTGWLSSLCYGLSIVLGALGQYLRSTGR